MRDLSNPVWIVVKAALFLLLGVLASTELILQRPEWMTAFLLGVAIWSFCRLYYFGFYVMERYVDSSYKFSGLGSLVRHLVLKRGE